MGVYRFEWYSRPYLNEEDAQTRANEEEDAHKDVPCEFVEEMKGESNES